MKRSVYVHIDLTRCEGHGICTLLLPERLDLDNWGFAVVDGSMRDAVDERRARRAMRACPRQAIQIQPIPTGES